MSKANFYVDPEFPVIDGVGHSDKQGYFNVKGGGSTNSTYLDALPPGQHLNYGWFDRAAIQPWWTSSAFPPAKDPSFVRVGSGSVASPGCLNAIKEGDTVFDRCGQSVLLSRVTVNGTVSRPGGIWTDPDGPTTVGTPYPHPLPKCFLALVADLEPNGGAFDPDLVFDTAQGRTSTIGGTGVPWLNHSWTHRFRVLAHDVIDFDDQPPLAFSLVNQYLFDGVTYERTNSDSNYVYLFRTKGFRFDVDLNDVLCKFSGNTGTYTDLVDFGLHFCAVWFNGYDSGSHVLTGFESLGLEYMYRLWFKDFLSPSSFAPAGADGGVVADEAPDLDLLADQSAILAGEALEPRRKKTKASEGFFNFRPRNDPALDAFPDDFEFARLKSAKRSKSRGSRGQKFRRTDDPGEFFLDEAEPPYRRGKY